MGSRTASLVQRLSGPSDQKAGIGGFRTKEEVDEIIYEASKGSAYFLNQQAKDAQLTIKVEALVKRLDRLVENRGGVLLEEEKAVDRMILELEKERDLTQVVAVIDADAFFASCEELNDPSLIGTAFAVGSGVLTTASYEARKYGCRSAQAGFVARKLCPTLKFVDLNFELYSACSKKIMAVLERYGTTSPASLDEAYISLTACCATESITPAEAVERIRAAVKEETGLTVSAGVSTNAKLSKIGADFNKPDGQYVIDPTREAGMEFMAPLPIRRVPGIGRVTERWLEAVGVHTVADIYKLRGKLYLAKEDLQLTFLLKAYLALGTTEIELSKREDRKSVGYERTFTKPLSTPEELDAQIRKTADALEEDLKRTEYSGRTISLIYKLETYESFTRSKTPGGFLATADQLYREAKKLLDKAVAERASAFDRQQKVVGCNGKRELRIRLLGIRMSNLRDESEEGKEKAKPGFEGWITKSPTKGSTSKGKSKAGADDQGPPPKAGYFSRQLPGDKPVKIENEGVEIIDDDEQETLIPPRSSDDLWNQLSPLPPDPAADALLPPADGTTTDPDLASEFHYKPFFTGGPSLDSRIELSIPTLAAPADRISFGKNKGKGKAMGPQKEEEGAMRDLECPVCSLIFKSSVVGFGKHIDQCLLKATASEGATSRTKKSSKRDRGKQTDEKEKVRKAVKSEKGGNGKSRRDEGGLGRFFK